MFACSTLDTYILLSSVNEGLIRNAVIVDGTSTGGPGYLVRYDILRKMSDYHAPLLLPAIASAKLRFYYKRGTAGDESEISAAGDLSSCGAPGGSFCEGSFKSPRINIMKTAAHKSPGAGTTCGASMWEDVVAEIGDFDPTTIGNETEGWQLADLSDFSSFVGGAGVSTYFEFSDVTDRVAITLPALPVLGNSVASFEQARCGPLAGAPGSLNVSGSHPVGIEEVRLYV
jgi:hypothetical protein